MKAIRTSAGSRGLESRRMTQSERAKLQPRDPRGRFAGFDTVMVMDEFGNIGVEPRTSERKFGYAISVTENPDAFGEITAINRWKNDDELKARDDRKHSGRILTRIKKQGVRTYAYYVDKEKPPNGWKDDDRNKVMLKILSHSVDETLPETRGHVYVVVDYHKAYKGAVRPLMLSKSKPWKKVDGDKYDSHVGPCVDVLQTHDYVASAARGNIEIGDPARTSILKMRIRKIEDGDLDG